MNIFVLDLDPKTCAQYHCDKHVVKMIVETAQLLSTAHHINGSQLASNDGSGLLYKKTHENHPCAIWARQSKENYQWLCRLGINLCSEYCARYGKVHKTEALINLLCAYLPVSFPEIGLKEFKQCMPVNYHDEDVTLAYKSYYIGEKSNILQYKNGLPNFLKNL